MIKQFSSEKEMLQYEADRRQFYLDEIHEMDRHWWNCYVQMLKHVFNPEYRALKKEYNSYEGGYWLDVSGHICSYQLNSLSSNDYPEGSIAIQRHGEAAYDAYVMYQGVWHKLEQMSFEDMMKGILSNDEAARSSLQGQERRSTS